MSYEPTRVPGARAMRGDSIGIEPSVCTRTWCALRILSAETICRFSRHEPPSASDAFGVRRDFLRPHRNGTEGAHALCRRSIGSGDQSRERVELGGGNSVDALD